MSSLSTIRKWLILLVVISILSGCAEQQTHEPVNPYANVKSFTVSDGATQASYNLTGHEQVVAQSTNTVSLLCNGTELITINVIAGSDELNYSDVYVAVCDDKYVIRKTPAGDYIKVTGKDSSKDYMSNLIDKMQVSGSS